MLRGSQLDFLSALETDPSLFEPEQLRARLEALDALNAEFEFLDAEASGEDLSTHAAHRAQILRNRLEAINTAIYQSIRTEIMRGAGRQAMLRWIETATSPEQAETTAPGPSYNCLDELLSGVLQLCEPSAAIDQLAHETVFYQPTPMRHILRMITACALSETDVLVDLGSGLGHVPLLASILTGARTIGIEMQPAYVSSARECAESLRLHSVRFIQEDARTADLSTGTVFYLYTPFHGSILANVLGRLQAESTSRHIKVCTFGPCATTVASQPWLIASAPSDPDQVTVFQTRF